MIVFVIEALIAWQFFSSIYTPKRNVRIQLLSFCGAYILLLLVSKNAIFWQNMLVFFVCNVVLALVVFLPAVKSAVFHSIILTAVMYAVEGIVTSVMSYTFFYFEVLKREWLYDVYCSLLCIILYFLLVQIILKIIDGNEKRNTTNASVTILLCFVPYVSLWIIANLSLLRLEGENLRQFDWMTITSTILLLIANLVTFGVYNYTQKTSRDYLEMQLQLQKENSDKDYYYMLAQRTEEQKILIHDIKKHLNAVDSLIEEKEYEAAQQYLKKINCSAEWKKIEFSDNESLNLLLTHYQNVCEENNIRLCVDVRKQSVAALSFEDITSLFGNLLENAYEACKGIPDAYIDMSIRPLNGKTIIVVVNPCRCVPKKQPDGTFLSTKNNSLNHGFGMKSIQKVVRKYNGDFDAYYDDANDTFHVVIGIDRESTDC